MIKKIIKLLTNIISIITSSIYGFTIMLTFDMVKRKIINVQYVFKLPTQSGLIKGVSFLISYLLLMALLERLFIYCGGDKRKFRKINGIIFAVALFIFYVIGACFFIDTTSGP